MKCVPPKGHLATGVGSKGVLVAGSSGGGELLFTTKIFVLCCCKSIVCDLQLYVRGSHVLFGLCFSAP